MAQTTRKIYFSQLKLWKHAETSVWDKEVPSVDVFHSISSLPFTEADTASSRYMSMPSGDALSLQIDKINDETGEIRGKLGLKRLTNYPLVEYQGNLEGLALPSGRGLYEICHFILYNDGVIGYESNQFGPRLNHLCRYLEEKATDLVDDIAYRLLWTREIAEKLQNVDAVTVFSMRAHRDLGDAISAHDEELGKVFQAASAWAEGTMIEIGIKVERHKRKGFHLPQLSSMVPMLGDAAIRQGIESLWIKAKNVDEKQARHLDLLQDNLIAVKSVVKDDRYRAIDSISMYSAIDSARRDLEPTIQVALQG